MEQTGYVVYADSSSAKVRVDRESACGGHCVSCKGCPTEAVIVELKNEHGLKEGDTVTMYEDTKKVIKYAFIGYGLLAVLLVVGAVVGFMLTKKDIFALLFAAVFLAIGFVIIKLLFRNVESEFSVISVQRNDLDTEELI